MAVPNMGMINHAVENTKEQNAKTNETTYNTNGRSLNMSRKILIVFRLSRIRGISQIEEISDCRSRLGFV